LLGTYAPSDVKKGNFKTAPGGNIVETALKTGKHTGMRMWFDDKWIEKNWNSTRL